MLRCESEIALPLLAGVALFSGLVMLNWSEVLFEFPSVTRAVLGPAVVLKDVVDAVNQVVSMLITISIGLFVFFGFIIKYSTDRGLPITVFACLLSFLFLFLEMISINIGYYVRAEMLLLMIERQAAFEHLSVMVARQAVFVHLSFVVGVVASIHVALLERRKQSQVRAAPVRHSPPDE